MDELISVVLLGLGSVALVAALRSSQRIAWTLADWILTTALMWSALTMLYVAAIYD